MSKQCNIVADLLPLYQDGVCSEDSRELVEAHLAGCADCRKLAEQMAAEITAPAKAEEIDALKEMKKAVRKGWKKAFLKGIAACLAALLLAFTGYFVWWYVNSYRFYAAFLNEKAAYDTAAWEGNAHAYTWHDERNLYYVGTPSLTRADGWAYLEPRNNSEAPDDFQYLAVNVCRGETEKYVFSININDNEDTRFFVVDRALNLIDYNESQAEEEVRAEFAECKETVRFLVDEAIKAWPFLGE